MQFKKSTAEQERACRTLCAFANAEGGQLLFGVTSAAVRQLTLLNLGRDFPLVKERWPDLCARLEQLLSGQQALMPMAVMESVERYAPHGIHPATSHRCRSSTPSRLRC